MKKCTIAFSLAVGLLAATILAEPCPVRRVKLPPRNDRGMTGQIQLAPFDSAAWIWRVDEALPPTGEFVRFRRSFTADGKTPLRFHVSADERFVLQLDGRTVARGPDRGDPKLWFAQTYEALPAKGEHLFEAICWRMPSHLSPNAQLSWRGGFLFKAEGVYDAQLTTGRANWTAARLAGTKMTSAKYPAGCVGAQCEIAGVGLEDERPADSAYGPTHVVRGPLPEPKNAGSTFCDGWLLYPTELPEQLAREVKSPGAFKAADDQTFATNGVWSQSARDWCSNGWYRASAAASPYVAQANALLREGRALTIPAHAKVRLLWNLGEYYCAYNEMTVSGGRGAKIGWSWAESLYTGDAFDWHTVVVGKERKGMTSRLKWEDKYFYGNRDVFRPDGRAHARFTMPWWHCGFWCQLEVETGDEPLVIENVKLVETRYPMEPQAYFDCDDASIAGVRRLCLRGLQECMHEMHFDCPYYEQQMYPGDTRIQMLTTAAMHADDSLTRQAFRLLEISQKDNGMVSMNYPTTWLQISTTFSLVWTYMLGDYAMWHDDVAWVRARMPAVRRWLEGLEAHAGPDGLGSDLPGWSFVDWVPGWNAFRGVPPGSRPGEDGSSVVNLEYLYALRGAVKVEQLLGEAELAARWNRKAEELAKAIERKFWCEARGLVADNGAKTAFSEHAQCLALLAKALPEDKAARAFKGLLEAPDLERCTVSFSHYLFDALIERGRADLVLKRLDLWRDMVRQDLRCPLEGPGDSRSDCHGWGAHPIYHLQTGIAGVKPASPGFRTVRVAPQPGGLKWIKAGTPSPKGLVEEDLRFDGDRVSGTVTLPAGLKGEFVWRGVSTPLVPGVNPIGGGQEADVPSADGDVVLDGAWEMAYRPYPYEPRVECPSFQGVVVPNAVPGYWEDMRDAFRVAGMKDEFRVNPWHHEVRLPESGWADELTLPDIYGTFFYRRTFTLDRVREGVLCFEGVRNQVAVWINGAHLAFRQGFSTPFEFRVPEKLLRVGTNEIILAVSNNPNLGYLGANVSGLTTRSLWRSTGGVNGQVALRFPAHDLRKAYVTTSEDLRSFTVHLPDSSPVAYTVIDPADGRTLLSGTGKSSLTLPTAGLSRWSPENPKLYELVLRANGGEERLPFGVRRLTAKGEKLFLNGEPVYLRGVTEHCYFPRTVHLPRDRAYYEMITAKRKGLGFNFVRFHTFVPPEEYFEATDRLGMLVHVETPNFVTEQEFAAIVRFARRHPSVVIYCTGNETRIDRLVEVYLANVAEIVHRETDALFSPMSALRGVEYALVPGTDKIVDRPFRHHAERAARVAAFSDLFTSYQLGATSYDSLNGRDAATLDRWGDAYCGRPRLSHEICIDGSYPDLSLERLYPADSPILKAGLFSEIRRVLGEKGLLDRADRYFRNSCEWMRRIRKHAFEKVRASDRTAGYDFLGDINTHWHTFGYFVGMMDEFYRLKPGETVANVRRYNAAAVVLADLGNDFNVVAGTAKRIVFSVSNYAAPGTNATLEVALVEPGTAERVVFSRTLSAGMVPNGALTALGALEIPVPATDAPRRYLVRAKLAGGALKAENEWEFYAFPKVERAKASTGVTVLEKATKAELLAHLAKGERVVLFGAGPFPAQSTTFRIGMAGRCRGSFATVIAENHPLFRDFPHEGYCGWQFRRLLEGGRAVRLEGDVPFDPIVDIASSEKLPIRQAGVFEYAVGSGRLLVCSFAFRENDPAAVWLRKRMLDYAASDAFSPRHAVTPEQLLSAIDSPETVGAANPNRARNPSDASSEVRAGANALP